MYLYIPHQLTSCFVFDYQNHEVIKDMGDGVDKFEIRLTIYCVNSQENTSEKH
jgi:hypothetical protein